MFFNCNVEWENPQSLYDVKELTIIRTMGIIHYHKVTNNVFKARALELGKRNVISRW